MRLAWFASLPLGRWHGPAVPPAVSTQPNMFVPKQNDVKPLQWKFPGPQKNNTSKLQQYEQPKHGINHPAGTLNRRIDLRLRPHTCSSLCLPSSNSCISSDHLATMRYLYRCGSICVWSGWGWTGFLSYQNAPPRQLRSKSTWLIPGWVAISGYY